ncbi:MAG: T9SS type A sorting domain-containing protein [Bacteroidota bacterium]
MIDPITQSTPDLGAEPRTLLNCLSDSILPQAHWLGLNLVSVNICVDDDLVNPHDHLRRDRNHWNNNAVTEICESAGVEGMQVLIADAQLGSRFSGQRIMLQPESIDDFRTQGSFTTSYHTPFDEYLFIPSPFARTLRDRKGNTPNSIKFTSNQDTVSGVTDVRLSELTALTEGTTPDADNVPGMYQLSVILEREEGSTIPDPPDDATVVVLFVDITYTDPGEPHGELTIHFPLTGDMFYEGIPGTRTLLTGVQEIALGAFELWQATVPNGGTLYAEQVDLTNPLLLPAWWTDAGLEYVRGSSGMGDLLTIRGDFDIQISYGTSNVPFWLDAVCLTNPATFGLWNPANRATLAEHQAHRGDMDVRLDFLVHDNGNATPIIPGLRFVNAPEQIASGGGYWSTMLFNRLLLEESGDRVEAFSTYGSWTYTETTPVLASEFITGPYNYPILTDHPRPTLQDVGPMDYCVPLYDEENTLNPDPGPDGIRQMWGLFRPNMVTRMSYPNVESFIPFIQNHTNLLITDPNNWWDGIPNREPSASELRLLCNTALAFGADGVMFWALSSVPWSAVDPTDPPTVLAGDRILPDPAHGVPWDDPIDMNNGTMGFLGSEGVEDVRRTLDWNGENKWDSTQQYIDDFLRPAGAFVAKHLHWTNSVQWYCRAASDGGASELVSMVVSRRQDITNGIDPQENTYVLVSEFKPDVNDPEPGSTESTRYLFVLNGNAYDGAVHATTGTPIGQRHITVKLSSNGQTVDEWRVTNVLTNDMWIVRASDTPDETSYANGFTEYFAPGEAALYRLDPYENGTVPFDDACFAHTLTITHGASVSLANASVVLAEGASIVVEDSLLLSNCAVKCCALEGTADIFVRDGGGMKIIGNSILNKESSVERVLISVGSNSHLSSERTHYSGIPYIESAITVVDGEARTYENAADLTAGGYFLSTYGNSTVWARLDSVQGSGGFLSIGIYANGGNVTIEHERLLDLTFGIFATGASYIQGCNFTAPMIGRSKIRASYVALSCQNSEMEFGHRPWGYPGMWYASQNSIGVVNPSTDYHVHCNGGVVHAYANFWGYGSAPPLQTCTPHVYGNVYLGGELITDPVPFTGGASIATPHKEASIAAPPPSGIRETVLQHLANNANASARNSIESFLQSGAGQTASVQDLAFLYRTMKQVDAQSLVADLLAVCTNRQDLRSKLLAADILKWEDDPGSALSLLNGYSFLGSDELLRDAMVRKAILYPLSFQGGYTSGLAVVDSLRSLVSFDSTLSRFIERYPRLFSGLTLQNPAHIPKVARRTYSDLLLPTELEVWPNYPNPFRDVTSFTFKLDSDMHVRLAVYDAMGREVAVVTDADYERGVHSAVLHSGDLPNGLYFYRLTTNAGVIQRKMMLMR